MSLCRVSCAKGLVCVTAGGCACRGVYPKLSCALYVPEAHYEPQHVASNHKPDNLHPCSRSRSRSKSSSEDEEKKKRGKKIYSSEGMFLGYENDFAKPKEESKAVDAEWVEQEKRNNQAALAAALATPVGAAAQAALGIPHTLGGTPAMSTAASSRSSLQSASALQLRLEAEKRARRLHVSNLPSDITEKKVIEFFNSAMVAAELTDNAKPVLNCFHNASKNYAFIEMSTLDEASKCLENLDGVTIGQSEVKITRPQVMMVVFEGLKPCP